VLEEQDDIPGNSFFNSCLDDGLLEIQGFRVIQGVKIQTPAILDGGDRLLFFSHGLSV